MLVCQQFYGEYIMGGNKAILIVIAVALLAILGIVAMKATEKTPEEKVADSISETVEDVGDAISGAVEEQE